MNERVGDLLSYCLDIDSEENFEPISTRLDMTHEFSGERLSSKHCMQDFTGILFQFFVMLVHRFLTPWRNMLIFSECLAEIRIMALKIAGPVGNGSMFYFFCRVF
jgi:hypothetical protein